MLIDKESRADSSLVPLDEISSGHGDTKVSLSVISSWLLYLKVL